MPPHPVSALNSIAAACWDQHSAATLAPSSTSTEGFKRHEIHVAPLPLDISECDLKTDFEEIINDKVLSVRLRRISAALGLPVFAHITFAHESSVQRAINLLNGGVIRGHIINVSCLNGYSKCCYDCGEPGHLARFCTNKAHDSPPSRLTLQPDTFRPVHDTEFRNPAYAPYIRRVETPPPDEYERELEYFGNEYERGFGTTMGYSRHWPDVLPARDRDYHDPDFSRGPSSYECAPVVPMNDPYSRRRSWYHHRRYTDRSYYDELPSTPEHRSYDYEHRSSFSMDRW